MINQNSSSGFHNEMSTPQLHPFMFQGFKLDYCNMPFNGGNLSTQEKGIQTFLAMVSMVAAVFVAMTIFYNPKLKQHPSSIIGYMCICEALSCFNALVWAIHPLDFICYFGLHELYSSSTFGR